MPEELETVRINIILPADCEQLFALAPDNVDTTKKEGVKKWVEKSFRNLVRLKLSLGGELDAERFFGLQRPDGKCPDRILMVVYTKEKVKLSSFYVNLGNVVFKPPSIKKNQKYLGEWMNVQRWKSKRKVNEESVKPDEDDEESCTKNEFKVTVASCSNTSTVSDGGRGIKRVESKGSSKLSEKLKKFFDYKNDESDEDGKNETVVDKCDEISEKSTVSLSKIDDDECHQCGQQTCHCGDKAQTNVAKSGEELAKEEDPSVDNEKRNQEELGETSHPNCDLVDFEKDDDKFNEDIKKIYYRDCDKCTSQIVCDECNLVDKDTHKMMKKVQVGSKETKKLIKKDNKISSKLTSSPSYPSSSGVECSCSFMTLGNEYNMKEICNDKCAKCGLKPNFELRNNDIEMREELKNCDEVNNDDVDENINKLETNNQRVQSFNEESTSAVVNDDIQEKYVKISSCLDIGAQEVERSKFKNFCHCTHCRRRNDCKLKKKKDIRKKKCIQNEKNKKGKSCHKNQCSTESRRKHEVDKPSKSTQSELRQCEKCSKSMTLNSCLTKYKKIDYENSNAKVDHNINKFNTCSGSKDSDVSLASSKRVKYKMKATGCCSQNHKSVQNYDSSECSSKASDDDFDESYGSSSSYGSSQSESYRTIQRRLFNNRMPKEACTMTMNNFKPLELCQETDMEDPFGIICDQNLPEDNCALMRSNYQNVVARMHAELCTGQYSVEQKQSKNQLSGKGSRKCSSKQSFKGHCNACELINRDFWTQKCNFESSRTKLDQDNYGKSLLAETCSEDCLCGHVKLDYYEDGHYFHERCSMYVETSKEDNPWKDKEKQQHLEVQHGKVDNDVSPHGSECCIGIDDLCDLSKKEIKCLKKKCCNNCNRKKKEEDDCKDKATSCDSIINQIMDYPNCRSESTQTSTIMIRCKKPKCGKDLKLSKCKIVNKSNACRNPCAKKKKCCGCCGKKKKESSMSCISVQGSMGDCSSCDGNSDGKKNDSGSEQCGCDLCSSAQKSTKSPTTQNRSAAGSRPKPRCCPVTQNSRASQNRSTTQKCPPMQNRSKSQNCPAKPKRPTNNDCFKNQNEPSSCEQRDSSVSQEEEDEPPLCTFKEEIPGKQDTCCPKPDPCCCKKCKKKKGGILCCKILPNKNQTSCLMTDPGPQKVECTFNSCGKKKKMFNKLIYEFQKSKKKCGKSKKCDDENESDECDSEIPRLSCIEYKKKKPPKALYKYSPIDSGASDCDNPCPGENCFLTTERQKHGEKCKKDKCNGKPVKDSLQCIKLVKKKNKKKKDCKKECKKSEECVPKKIVCEIKNELKSMTCKKTKCKPKDKSKSSPKSTISSSKPNPMDCRNFTYLMNSCEGDYQSSSVNNLLISKVGLDSSQ